MARVKVQIGVETKSGGVQTLVALPIDLITQERGATDEMGAVEQGVYLAWCISRRLGHTLAGFDEWVAEELLDMWSVRDEDTAGKAESPS